MLTFKCARLDDKLRALDAGIKKMRALAANAQQEWLASENGQKKKAELAQWESELLLMKNQLKELEPRNTIRVAMLCGSRDMMYRTAIYVMRARGDTITPTMRKKIEDRRTQAAKARDIAIHCEMYANNMQASIDEHMAIKPILDPYDDGSPQYITWRLNTNRLEKMNKELDEMVKSTQ